MPLLRNGPEGSTYPLAEKIVIHSETDVDQTKGATANAVKGSYIDECIYKVLLLTPCIVPGWSCGNRYGRLLSHKTPWRAVVRQVRLASIRRCQIPSVTEIAEAAIGACHEPDVQAPDVVPNVVVQSMPLLRNGPEGLAWALWPEGSSSIPTHRQERICLCPCVGHFDVRYAAMHQPTLPRNAGSAAIGR